MWKIKLPNYKLSQLISVDCIFHFFSQLNYDVEKDISSFPISELIEKEIDGEAWTVINDTNRSILIVKSSNYNRKSYRNKVNNYLKELAGTQIIFYTKDFTHYNLTLIFDGIFNIKFNPSNPNIDVVRIFEAFENQEDLFDYTKQDINFILLKRQLTAKILKDSIREGDNSSVKIAFQDGGIKLIGESLNKVAVSFDDAPIRDLVIDVKLKYNSDVIRDEDIDFISNLYKNTTGRNLKLVCIITEKGLLYHWHSYSISGYIGFINQLKKDVSDEVLESLIAQVSSRTAFNSETFHQQFGTYSPFFILGTKLYINI